MNNSDPEYKNLLAICKKMYLKARELIPYSANKPHLKNWAPHRTLAIKLVRKRTPELSQYKKLINRLNLFIGDDEAPDHFLKKKLIGTFDGMKNPSMEDLLNKVESMQHKHKSRHKNGASYEKQHDIENQAKKAIQFGIGNCGELSALTYALLLEYDNLIIKNHKIRIESMYCKKGDHAFVVVNRKPDSKEGDLSTWGSEAIIIDSWDGDIMYAETGKSVFNFLSPRYYNYYEYIKTHSPCVETSGYIGEGLSERFIAHAEAKQRPHRFFSWSPKYTGHKRTDKKKELDTIPIDLQDDNSNLKKKRNCDEINLISDANLPIKKRRMSY